MSEIKYTTVKNTIEGAKEPFNGIVLHNRTMTKADLVDELCKDSIVAKPDDANLILNAIAGAIAETVGQELLRVNAGQITFEPAISGSVASMDAPLTADNRIYVNMRVSEAVRNAIKKLEPVLDGSGGAAAYIARIDKIEDVATHVRAIVGTDRFVITGRNLFVGTEGEGVTLSAPGGTSYAAVVQTGETGATGERLYCALAQAIPAGAYTLTVKTRGGAGGDTVPSEVKRLVEVR